MAKITSITLPDDSVYYLGDLKYSTDTTNDPNVWRLYYGKSSFPVIAADLANNMSISSGLDQNVKKSGVLTIYANGFAMANPGTNNDQGWIRMLGTGESDSVLEIATGDDGNEKIVCRQYFTNGNYREACILDSSGNSEFYGNITTYGNYESKNATVTINKSSNNGVAADQFYYHAAKDSANYRYGLLQFGARTNGDTDVCLRAHNKKTDGTEVQNGLWLYAHKNGTRTYVVSDPANFRKAIEACHFKSLGSAGSTATSFAVNTTNTHLIVTGHNSTASCVSLWLVRLSTKTAFRLATGNASTTTVTVTCPDASHISVKCTGGTVNVFDFYLPT